MVPFPQLDGIWNQQGNLSSGKSVRQFLEWIKEGRWAAPLPGVVPKTGQKGGSSLSTSIHGSKLFDWVCATASSLKLLLSK